MAENDTKWRTIALPRDLVQRMDTYIQEAGVAESRGELCRNVLHDYLKQEGY